MSEVKRYMENCGEGGGVFEHPKGDLVLLKDFNRVTAERDAALLELSEIKESLAYRGSLLCRIQGQRDALQQRLTAADERADVLEGLLRRVVDSSVLSFEQDAPEELESLEADICAALKPAEGGGDAVGRVSLSDKALSLIDEEIRNKGLPS